MIIILYDRLRISARWLGQLSLPELIKSNIKASTERPCNTELNVRVSVENGRTVVVDVRLTIRHEMKKSVPNTAARR